MGYIEDSLAPGERVVYKTRLHWGLFVWPGVFSVLTYISFVSDFGILRQIFQALALFTAIYFPALYLLSVFAVTNRRVMGKLLNGRVSRYTEVSLMEIRDVEFKRGLLGKFVNYGSVVITDRHGKKHRYGGLPTEFYRQVHARLARMRRILQ